MWKLISYCMTKKLLISVHFSIDSGKQEMRIAQVTFEEKPQIRINSSNKKTCISILYLQTKSLEVPL